MTNGNNNLIVCFPGGAGGHFVAALCVQLLYPNFSYNVNEDGSLHYTFEGYEINDPRLMFQHSGKQENLDAEVELIRNLPDFDYACAHLQRVDELSAKNKKVVYITFEPDDKDRIYSNVKSKMPLEHSLKSYINNKDRYDAVKGSSWPTWEEFREGNICEELSRTLADPESHDNPFLDDWKYTLPDISNNICEIKYKEVLNGTELLNKLLAFLDIRQYNIDKINLFIDNYRNKNREIFE